MNNIKNELNKLFEELHNHEELKELKTVSVIFFCGSRGYSLSEEFKDRLTDLIKKDEITVFGGSYTTFDKLSREEINNNLKNEKLFPQLTIGLS